MNKGGFSWKRAVGITRVKQSISRTTGIPLTRSGRQRKIGKAATGGCCLLNIGLIITLVLLIIIILSFSLVSCVKQANLTTATKVVEETTTTTIQPTTTIETTTIDEETSKLIFLGFLDDYDIEKNRADYDNAGFEAFTNELFNKINKKQAADIMLNLAIKVQKDFDSVDIKIAESLKEKGIIPNEEQNNMINMIKKWADVEAKKFLSYYKYYNGDGTYNTAISIGEEAISLRNEYEKLKDEYFK